MENSLVMTDLSNDGIDVDEIVKLLDAVGGSDPSVSEKPNREFPICLDTVTNLEQIGMKDLLADDEYGCLDVDEIMKLLKSEESAVGGSDGSPTNCEHAIEDGGHFHKHKTSVAEAKENSICTEISLEQQSEWCDFDYVHEMMEILNLCDLEASMIGANDAQALGDVNWQHSVS